MANALIRETAKKKGVRLWQIAERIGINDGNFSRMLRRELTAEKTEHILAIIDSISNENDRK